jgi:hypothetical protein
VGLGRAGWDIHVHELRPRADAKIVAVADPVAERREQAVAEFGCKAYPTLAKLLKQDDIEVVVIRHPVGGARGGHEKVIRCRQTRRRRKAMAMSVAEADAMIAASEAAGKKLFVTRTTDSVRSSCTSKRSSTRASSGGVYHMRQALFSFVRRNDWQTLAKNGGGVLNNTCRTSSTRSSSSWAAASRR